MQNASPNGAPLGQTNQRQLTFSRDRGSSGFDTFRQSVGRRLAHETRGRHADSATLRKAFCLAIIAIGSYLCLLLYAPSGAVSFGFALTSGVSTLLFALNASHDAAHGSFSKRTRLNGWVLHFPFTVLGVDPAMWRTRHLLSHHKFPNIDSCDADIDENSFIRLSPFQKWRSWHRFQHFYAWLVYALVAPHAAWVQDFNYMKRDRLANMNDWRSRNPSWSAFLARKAVHLQIAYVIPMAALPFGAWQIVFASLAVQGVLSILFILPLIGTHFSSAAEFPKIEDGEVGCSYVTHQLRTSIDWHPESRLACSFVGGLNAHAAHHLFPHVSHSHYHWISRELASFCDETELPYHKLSLLEAIRSHFTFLKTLSFPPRPECQRSC